MLSVKLRRKKCWACGKFAVENEEGWDKCRSSGGIGGCGKRLGEEDETVWIDIRDMPFDAWV